MDKMVNIYLLEITYPYIVWHSAAWSVGKYPNIVQV